MWQLFFTRHKPCISSTLYHRLAVEHCVFRCLSTPTTWFKNIPHLHRLPFFSSVLNFGSMSSTLRRCLPPAPGVSCTISFGFGARRPCLLARHAALLSSNSRRPLFPQLLAVKTLTGALRAGSDKREDLAVVCLQVTKHKSWGIILETRALNHWSWLE